MLKLLLHKPYCSFHSLYLQDVRLLALVRTVAVSLLTCQPFGVSPGIQIYDLISVLSVADVFLSFNTIQY